MPLKASGQPKLNATTPRKPKQFALLKREKSSYGGELLKTRAGRSHGRPLSTRETMHLVLRSTQARGEWSFKRANNDANIQRIVSKFSMAYGIRVISMANVGNHLHLQIKLANRFTYGPFIRAITGAIAMAVTGRTRWNKLTPRRTAADKPISPEIRGSAEREIGHMKSRTNHGATRVLSPKKFWDYRPFTRIVQSFKAFLNLKDYIKINELEGYRYKRDDARFMLAIERRFEREHDPFA